MADYEGPLAKVINDQSHKDQIPGALDRLTAKVPHISIERFSTGRTEDYFGEDEESGHTVFSQKADGIVWADRRNNTGKREQGDDAGYCQGGKPDYHDWAESFCNLVSAFELKNEQNNGNNRGNKNQH